MELRQESLFADETKGGIEVIYSKFIDQRRMDYKALFGGFDHLRVITFSYGLGFVETVADMFEDVEIIIGSMNTVRPDIVDVAMHQKLEMKRLSKRKQLVERVKDGSVRIYFNMRKMSHEKLYILSADDGRCRIITGSANLSKRAFTGGQYEEKDGRFANLRGLDSRILFECRAPKGSFDWVEPGNVISERVFFKVDGDWYVDDAHEADGAKAKRRERARRDFYRNVSSRSFHPTKAFLDKWVREMYGWKNVRLSDVVIAKETCAEGIYYRVRKTVGNGDFFSVTSFGKR